eukprot:1178142-Prorocentrum_minimum.AAC.1
MSYLYLGEWNPCVWDMSVRSTHPYELKNRIDRGRSPVEEAVAVGDELRLLLPIEVHVELDEVQVGLGRGVEAAAQLLEEALRQRRHAHVDLDAHQRHHARLQRKRWSSGGGASLVKRRRQKWADSAPRLQTTNQTAQHVKGVVWSSEDAKSGPTRHRDYRPRGPWGDTRGYKSGG